MFAQCVRVFLVSAFRKKTALVVLLAVLPPTLITLALTASVSAVGLLSEDLVRHFSGGALLISREPLGINCSRVGYGLATLVYGDGLTTTTPVVYALDAEELSKLLGTDLLKEAGGCPTPAVLLPRSFGVLETQLPTYVEISLGGERLNICAVHTKLRVIGAPVVIGGLRGHSETGFLCSTNSASVGRWITDSVISDVSQFTSKYSLLVTAAYVPALYLVSLKVLDEMKQEVRVLSNAGVSRRKLAAAFTSFCSVTVLVASLYCLSLGYTILMLGRVLLAYLGAATFPPPALELNYLLLPIALSLVEAPPAYIVIQRGYYRAAS